MEGFAAMWASYFVKENKESNPKKIFPAFVIDTRDLTDTKQTWSIGKRSWKKKFHSLGSLKYTCLSNYLLHLLLFQTECKQSGWQQNGRRGWAEIRVLLSEQGRAGQSRAGRAILSPDREQRQTKAGLVVAGNGHAGKEDLMHRNHRIRVKTKNAQCNTRNSALMFCAAVVTEWSDRIKVNGPG